MAAPYQNDPEDSDRSVAAWGWLVVAATVVGVATGGVGAAFRWVLEHADDGRNELVEWAEGLGAAGWLVPVAVCAAGAGVGVWLVQRFAPYASGSGIPQVEEVVAGAEPPAPVRPFAVKFVGGALGIGSGLALGREGPTVQMGATVGHLVSLASARLPSYQTLMAAGAGAGLAAAFNAPLASAIFVAEELTHRFRVRLVAATIIACAAAVTIERLWLGSAPDFDVPAFEFVGAGALVAFAILGVLAGLAGVAFNRCLLATLRLADRLRGLPRGTRGAAVGGIVGLVAWFFPNVVGGGESLAQEVLVGEAALGALVALFAGRFALTLASYGTGGAGGLFAPLLVLGVVLGRFFGEAGAQIAPDAAPDQRALALAGMAGYVVASVRAPLTGVVLILEMTGAFSLLLPVVVTAATAYLVPWVLRDAPVYDSLRERDEAWRLSQPRGASARL